MKTGGKVAALAFLAIGLVVGIGYMTWSREAGAPVFQQRIKDRLIVNFSSSGPVRGLKPSDISFVSYVQKPKGNGIEFTAKVRVRRIPFHPTSLPIGDKVVPTGWVELDISGRGHREETKITVGSATVERPSLTCGSVKVASAGLIGPDEINEAWRDGKNLDPNLMFDVLGRKLELKPMLIDPDSLFSLFMARDLRQQGRFGEAEQLVENMHIARIPEPQPWTDWQRAERALIGKKSTAANHAAGVATLFDPDAMR